MVQKVQWRGELTARKRRKSHRSIGSTFVYSRITSTKSPSFCMTTFSACLTDFTVLRHLRDCRKTELHTHTLPTSTVSLGSLILPAPEAGDFVELLLLYSVRVRNRVITPTEHTSTHYPNEARNRHWYCCGCHAGAWWREGKCSLVLNFDTRWANQLQTLCASFPHAVRR